MNKTLLRRIQRIIVKTPEKFNIAFWANGDIRGTKCGSVCCIAGWALIDTGYKAKRVPIPGCAFADIGFVRGRKTLVEHDDIVGAAAKALRIDKETARTVFFEEHWPEDLRIAHEGSQSNLERAFLAAARIERLLND